MSGAGSCRIETYQVKTGARFAGKKVEIFRFLARGRREGPTVTITAAQHGRELNGIEVARRIMEWGQGKRLRGTLQVFPVVNPPAVEAVSQTVPGETQNLNRIWPGREKGTVTERIAAAVAPYVAESDYLIDLHCWSQWSVSTALISSLEGRPALDLARAFGLRFVFSNVRG
ncbi:unnamed protein product, partial [marine sediment metagenome]